MAKSKDTSPGPRKSTRKDVAKVRSRKPKKRARAKS